MRPHHKKLLSMILGVICTGVIESAISSGEFYKAFDEAKQEQNIEAKKRKYAEIVQKADFFNPATWLNAVWGSYGSEINEENQLIITVGSETIILTPKQIESLVYMIKLAFAGKITDCVDQNANIIQPQAQTDPSTLLSQGYDSVVNFLSGSKKSSDEDIGQNIIDTRPIIIASGDKTFAIDVQRNSYLSSNNLNANRFRLHDEYCYFVLGTSVNTETETDLQNRAKAIQSTQEGTNKENAIAKFLEGIDFYNPYIRSPYKLVQGLNNHKLRIYTNYTIGAQQYQDVTIYSDKRAELLNLIANPDPGRRVVIIKPEYDNADGYHYRYAICFNGKSFYIMTPVYVSSITVPRVVTSPDIDPNRKEVRIGSGPTSSSRGTQSKSAFATGMGDPRVFAGSGLGGFLGGGSVPRGGRGGRSR